MTVEQDALKHFSEVSVALELETPEMTLNIGPQHPSTHGVLRIVAKVDGERVSDVNAVIGYMHRGYEKIAEVRSYPQITALVNRIDWVSGYANEIPFLAATEKLMGIEVPERARYIRMILTEMARISSHLMFMASYPLELGATTPLMFALRERERILDLIESVTGGRFHPNFNRIGGVKPNAGAGPTQKKASQDLPKGFLQGVRDAMDKLLSTCDQFDDLVTGNEIFLARCKGIGVMTPELAAEYGVSGPNLRASGVSFDLRTHSDFLPYDQVEFEVAVGETGDSFDRWLVRLEEIRQSAHIVQQAVDQIPAGPLQSKVPKIIKVPKGEAYVRAENPKGEMGYYVVSEGGQGPYRLKIRSASYSNISVIPILLEGVLVPDILAIMGSFDFVLGDVDR